MSAGEGKAPRRALPSHAMVMRTCHKKTDDASFRDSQDKRKSDSAGSNLRKRVKAAGGATATSKQQAKNHEVTSRPAKRLSLMAPAYLRQQVVVAGVFNIVLSISLVLS